MGREMASVTFTPICLLKGPAGGGGRENRQQGSEEAPRKKRGQRQMGSGDSCWLRHLTGDMTCDPVSRRETCSPPDAAGKRSSSHSCLLWQYLSHGTSSSEVEAVCGTFQDLSWALEKEHCLFCLAYSRKRLTTWRRECISYRPEAALTLRVAADLAEVNTPCRSDA